MSPPVYPQIDPAELWDWLVGQKKLSPEQATMHVGRYLQSVDPNTTARIQAELDPGALAAFGLGVSQAGTFGFGDELAGLVEGLGAAVVPGGHGFGEAYRDATSAERLTRAEGRERHPVAYWSGEVTGTLPALAGTLVTKAPAVASTLGRAGTRVAISAAKGAGLAATEAAGRTDEGTLAERLTAGAEAAPIGAVIGGALPYAPAAARVAGRKLAAPARAALRTIDEFLEEVAGRRPSRLPLPRIKADILPGTPGLPPTHIPEDLTQEIATYRRRGILEPPSRATAPGVLGERPVIPASPAETRLRTTAVINADKAQAAIRRLSYADLSLAFQNPETPKALRQLLIAEFQRRGLTLPARALTP